MLEKENDFKDLHMSENITALYGEMLGKYIIVDALLGKYHTAMKLYEYIYGSEESASIVYDPTLSNYYEFIYKIIDIINPLVEERMVQEITSKQDYENIEKFFIGNLKENNKSLKSECSYWEYMFIYAWIIVLHGYLSWDMKNIDNNKANINMVLKTAKKTSRWYIFTFCESVLWSMEILRLRLYADGINDNKISFLDMSDWLDILEYRVMPQILADIWKMKGKENDRISNTEIYTLFINEIRKKTKAPFPFGRRYGFEKEQSKAMWRLRLSMLPKEGMEHDISLKGDVEIYNELMMMFKEKSGQLLINGATYQTLHKIVRARERLSIYKKAKTSDVIALIDWSIIEVNDEYFIDTCVAFLDRVLNSNEVSNVEQIKAVIISYYILMWEFKRQEEEYEIVANIKNRRDNLMKLIYDFRKKEITNIIDTHSGISQKKLRMGMELQEIQDELLADMIIIGHKNSSERIEERILGKLFSRNINKGDEERNRYINEVGKMLLPEDRMIFSLYNNLDYKMRRIRGGNLEEKYDDSEIEYITKMTKWGYERLNMVHTVLEDIFS